MQGHKLLGQSLRPAVHSPQAIAIEMKHEIAEPITVAFAFLAEMFYQFISCDLLKN